MWPCHRSSHLAGTSSGLHSAQLAPATRASSLLLCPPRGRTYGPHCSLALPGQTQGAFLGSQSGKTGAHGSFPFLAIKSTVVERNFTSRGDKLRTASHAHCGHRARAHGAAREAPPRRPGAARLPLPAARSAPTREALPPPPQPGARRPAGRAPPRVCSCPLPHAPDKGACVPPPGPSLPRPRRGRGEPACDPQRGPVPRGPAEAARWTGGGSALGRAGRPPQAPLVGTGWKDPHPAFPGARQQSSGQAV